MKKIILILMAFVMTLFITVSPTYAAESAEGYAGSNIGFLGDSITFGVGTTGIEKIYTALAGEELNFDNVYNYGVSGSRIATESDRTDSFLERYSAMEADLDIIFVFGGVNDFQTGALAIGSSTDAANTSLYGNINLLMDGLQTNYPDATIIFITSYNYDNTSFDSKVANATTGLTLDAINTVIKERAIAHKIDVIELDKYFGEDLYTDAVAIERYTSDGLHLNDEGHDHLSNLLISYMQKVDVNYFGENLFVVETITAASLLTPEGTVANEGTSTLFASDYIEVKAGYSYVGYAQMNSTKSVYLAYVYFYDANKNYVSNPTNDLLNPIFTIPEGVKYIRINGSTIEQRLVDTYVRELVNYPIYKVEFVTGLYTEFDSMWIEEGLKVNVNEPTSAYNTFSGWYTDASYNTLFEIDSDSVTTDLTLYARWIITSAADSDSDGTVTGGTITAPAETAEFLGIAWYWWTAIAIGGYGLFFTKKGKKLIGLK